MSISVEHRVVAMRFDNKQFESATKQTLGTLNRLKEALKLPNTAKALEGIDKATRNISLDGIASGVDALNKRFSSLGIVGMRVIENITDGLMNRMGQAINFVTDSIVSGGIRRAKNIENAHFQLQALLKDETKVQAIMADAMEAVDGTAYAYDEAAKAASQFAASGMEAGDEMLNALKGVTGVAAMTNSSFEDISRIFTTVAGNGRLMGDQLLQLSSRGLNAASTIADYFREVRGQSSMTEAQIREMVSRGQISFKDFSEAMTWAFGESAKRANETFTGAFSNMKSALARTGAGFISPLVEQNGELVKLFNALRVQINAINSTLLFDEQRSAISGITKQMDILVQTTSGLVKDGTIGFDKITTAIFGTSKAGIELYSSNSKLVSLFETVREAGSLSFETLQDISNEGINAAEILADYMNGVLDGTVKVSSDVKDAIYEITGGRQTMARDISRMVESGAISFDMFTDAMVSASDIATKETDLVNQAVTKLFNNVKESGHVTTQTLVDFKENGIDATDALLRYINGVSNGSIRATYATKQAIEQMTGGMQMSNRDISKFAEEGKISFDIFKSAMETAYGDQKTLSKQFTDSVLDTISVIVSKVKTADLTKPMEAFYYSVESVKNVFKGLWSVIKPIGGAFKDVFLGFSADDVVDLAEAIENLTAKMRLSEKGSQDLHDAFKGVFDVTKLLIDIAVALLRTIIPINEPVVELGNNALGLAGGLGRTLSAWTEWIRQSPKVKAAYDGLSNTIKALSNVLSWLIRNFSGFIGYLYNLPIVQKAITQFAELFTALRDFQLIDFSEIGNSIFTFVDRICQIDFSDPTKAFDTFRNIVDLFISDLSKTDLFNKIITNIRNFSSGIKDGFNFEAITQGINGFVDSLKVLFGWLGEKFTQVFGKVNVFDITSLATGFTILYTSIKTMRGLEKITGFLSGFNGILLSFQKSLKADVILKISASIAILAGSLVLLSHVKWENLGLKAFNFGITVAVLVLGLAAILDSVRAGFKDSAGGALVIASLGLMIRKMAESLMIIAGSIIALGIMYTKNREGFDKGVELTLDIGGALAFMLIVATALEKWSLSNKSVSKASLNIIALSASLMLVVTALNKLFKMEFPDDWKLKLGILSGIFVALSTLLIILTRNKSIINGNDFKLRGLMSAAVTIISVSSLLSSAVSSLNKLFKMELPKDWLLKVGILTVMIGSIGKLMAQIAIAGGVSGGNALKAGGTIIAISSFLITTVGSLMVLSLLPFDKILKGSVGIGIALVSLATSIRIAGKNLSNGNSAKAVLSMTLAMSSIVGSLLVLAFIPVDKIKSSVAALSFTLVALGATLAAASKATKEGSWKSILATIVPLLSISYALFMLSRQNWDSMLAAAGSISAVLLAFSKAFSIVIKEDWSSENVVKIIAFVTATLSLLPIVSAIESLASKPWAGLLTSATAISGVLLAFAECFKILGKATTPKLDILPAFGFLLLILELITVDLIALSDSPWSSMLAATLSISTLLLAMTGIMVILSKANVNIGAATNAAIALSAFVGVLSLVFMLLGEMLSFVGTFVDTNGILPYLESGIEAFKTIAYGLGSIAQSFTNGMILTFTSMLPQIGQDLSNFMKKLEPFISALDTIDLEKVETVRLITGIVFALTSEAFVLAVGKLFGIKLTDVAHELARFMEKLQPFIEMSSGLTIDSMQACLMIAEMIKILTESSVMDGLSKITGSEKSFSDFARELKKMAPALVEFAEQVKDITPEMVQGAINAATLIASVYEKLPNAGGLWQKVAGEKMTLTEFARELSNFGQPLVDFANTVGGNVTEDDVNGAVAAANLVAGVYEKLPDQWGMKQFFTGEGMTLTEFAWELNKFGQPLVDFANTVGGLTDADVEGGVKAATLITTLYNVLPEIGGFFDLFTGSQMTLSDFGLEIYDLGEDLKDFSDALKGADFVLIDSSVTSMYELINLAKQYNADGGTSAQGLIDFAAELIELGDSLKDAGRGLGKFGEDLIDLSEGLKAIDTRTVSDVVKTFNALINLADSIDANSATNSFTNIGNVFADSLKNSGPAISTSVDVIFDTIITKIENRNSDIKTSANNVVATFITAFTLSFASETTSLISKMELRGKQIIDGLNNGLKSGRTTLRKTATLLASTIDDAVCQRLEIHSPSRVARNRGQMFDQGFIEGLGDLIDDVKEGGSEIASWAIDGFTNTFLGGTDGITSLFDAFIPDMNLDELSYALSMPDFKINTSSVIEGEKSLLDEVNEVYKKYADELKSNRDTILSSFDIFTEVNKKEAISKEDLKKNLEEQTQLYLDYANVLNSLTARLGDSEFVEYLRTMGVDSIDQLKVINAMTDEELLQYSQLYDQRLAAANIAAQSRLVELQNETEQKLTELFGGIFTKVDLTEFESVFDGTAESLEYYLNELFIPMERFERNAFIEGQKIGTSIIDGIGDGFTNVDVGMQMSEVLIDSLPSDNGEITKVSNEIGENIANGIAVGMSDANLIRPASEDVVNTIVDSLKDGFEIHSPSALMDREIGSMLTAGIANGMTGKLEDLNLASEFIITSIIDVMLLSMKSREAEYYAVGNGLVFQWLSAIKDQYPNSFKNGQTLAINAITGARTESKKFFSIGEYAAQGFINGILSKVKEAAEAAAKLAKEAYDAAKAALDEHSPSKKMWEVGDFAGLGFIEGLLINIAKAHKAGEEIANETYEGISSVITDDITDPVIKPMVDMEDVNRSFEDIRRMFNEALSETANLATSVSATFVPKAKKEETKQTAKEEDKPKTTVVYNQYNTSPKALSRIEIYRSTKNQLSRFETEVQNV